MALSVRGVCEKPIFEPV